MRLNQATINEQSDLRDCGYSNALGSATLPRHRWYFVKEAFAPGLVERALTTSGLPQGGTVVDPFCGSGTVPLTAAATGYGAVAIEVNPFLAFVARTKLSSGDAARLRKGAAAVRAGVRLGGPSPLESVSTFSEGSGRSKWLFNRPVLHAYEGGRLAAERLQPPERDLAKLALLGAAMDVCNATRDGKCLRYRSNWRELNFGRDAFLAAFDARIHMVAEDVEAAPLAAARSRVLLGDCRAELGGPTVDRFDLCVTSPPYLNSFDYSDVYRPELFLGGFVADNAELMRIRVRTVRSHLQAQWPAPRLSDFGVRYRQAIEGLQGKGHLLWNRRIPTMVQAYFEDMSTVLSGLRRSAGPAAQVWLLVSTSAYAGVEIPVDLIIADIASQLGWYLHEVSVLRYLRTAGQHWARFPGPEGAKPRLRESVVILGVQRPGRPM